MHQPPFADLLGRASRSLPSRRYQFAHWVGKLCVPRGPFIGRFHGGRIEVHPGETASTLTFFTGFYEREVTMWARHLILKDPPALVVDVGANFGYYPLLFGLLSQGKIRSIAFEPDPLNFDWLRRNVALNPEVDVKLEQAAVGSTDSGVVAFNKATEGANLWAQVKGVSEARPDAEVIEVPVTTLDGYLERERIERVPLVMIDVEGYEGHVIKGMSSGIAANRYDRVMLEFHPGLFADPRTEFEEILDRFQSAGYDAKRFRPYKSQRTDKEPAFYRLDWNESILSSDLLDADDAWPHYLFTLKK